MHHTRSKRSAPPIETTPSDRPVAQTVLDDLLLDAEYPPASNHCLPSNVVEFLEKTEERLLAARGSPLSEYMDECSMLFTEFIANDFPAVIIAIDI